MEGSPHRARPLDDRWIDDDAARRLRRVALWWGPGAAVALAVGAVAVGVPASGEAGFWETAGQVALLGVYTVAALLARRWAMPAATVMVVTAFGIGALSALRYHPWWGLMLATLLAAPAVLLWLVWQRRRRIRAVAALACVLALTMAVSGYAGTRLYETVQGPQTAQSARGPYPATGVRWVWSGAVTPTSFTVVARLDSEHTAARLVYGTDADLTGPVVRTASATADPATNAVRFAVTGLDPATRYSYAVELDGRIDLARRGTVRTTDTGPRSFTVAFGSCIRTGSNAEVFETVRRLEPDLFLLTGDQFYADIAEDRVGDYVRAYDIQRMQGAQQALALAVPIGYVWDDHDYGPNDGDRTSRSRPAALASYRALVPHAPFALAGEDAPIAQAFTVGRVRFLLTDLRSARDPKTQPDGPDKSMLGPAQLAWFERELVAAARSHAAVVWVSSVPWIDRSASPGDDWGAYATERRRIADLVAANGIRNLVMLAGDAHMVAADDGSNADFATAGGGGFPVLQAAALDRQPSEKGGPYSEGAVPGAGQFGLLRVTDDGGPTVTIAFEGRRWDGEVLVSLRLRVGPA